jgi:transposase-like protein
MIVKKAAAQQSINHHTAYKWLKRYNEGGEAVIEKPELVASAHPQGAANGGITLPAHKVIRNSPCPFPQ